MLSNAILMVRGGPEGGKSIALAERMMMVGRSPGNDIVVDHPGVSRRHASIRGDSHGYWIADWGSHNGTLVNGESVGTEPRRLLNFDRIDLGGTSTPFHWVFMESQSTVDLPGTLQE